MKSNSPTFALTLENTFLRLPLHDISFKKTATHFFLKSFILSLCVLLETTWVLLCSDTGPGSTFPHTILCFLNEKKRKEASAVVQQVKITPTVPVNRMGANSSPHYSCNSNPAPCKWPGMQLKIAKLIGHLYSCGRLGRSYWLLPLDHSIYDCCSH